MSHCRFEGTYNELMDCHEAIWSGEELSEREEEYKNKLLRLCRKILELEE